MARTKEFDKEQVLEKAMDIFWIKGYNGTSMQELVDGLGISRSSMYDTFGDKEALFYAALDWYNNKYQVVLVESLLMAESPLEVIKDLFANQIVQSVTDPNHKGCFMVNTTTELAACTTKASDLICRNSDEVLTALTSTLERGQQMGEIQTRNTAEQLAKFILNATIGMRVAARGNRDQQYLLDIAAVTISAIKV